MVWKVRDAGPIERALLTLDSSFDAFALHKD